LLRFPLSALRSSIRLLSEASPPMRARDMGVSSGMPIVVSPRALTDHGCMRQYSIAHLLIPTSAKPIST
jgi:hypothetical protein